MTDLTRPIDELVSDVRSGKLTAVQLVQQSLDAMREHDDYHAILEVSSVALQRATEIDTGDKTGKLAGIPFIAKDNFLTHATHSTAASNILKPFVSPYQATAIGSLEAEGAIMVAKANLDAFGHGGSTENSDFGPTMNPHSKEHVSGGSSGGSAAAVALGLACFALGTDTGGSSRQPAAFCGVVGFKPTYGLISRYGVVAMGSSFDTIGTLANRSSDVAYVLDVLAGKDVHDATTIERADSYVPVDTDLKGKKIGLIKEYLSEGTSPAVKSMMDETVEMLREAGAVIEEISLPSLQWALACYYILVPAEISSNLARYDGIRYGHSSDTARSLNDTYFKSRDEGFGDEAKRRIMIGTYVLSSGYYDAYYKKAQQVRTLMIRDFNAAFKSYDLLIGPTVPTAAFKLGEKSQDPLAMYAADIDTVASNLVGVPTISIPAGEYDGLPLGIQLLAPQREENKLLAAAAAVEALIGKSA